MIVLPVTTIFLSFLLFLCVFIFGLSFNETEQCTIEYRSKYRSFFFLLIYLILFNRYWIYSFLARSRLSESCTHRCNVDK